MKKLDDDPTSSNELSESVKENLKRLKGAKIAGALYTHPYEVEVVGQREIYPGCLHVYFDTGGNAYDILTLFDPTSDVFGKVEYKEIDNKQDVSEAFKGGKLGTVGSDPKGHLMFGFTDPQDQPFQVSASQFMILPPPVT